MKVAVRIALLVTGFAVAGVVLWRAFDGFDLASVGSTLGDLTWSEIGGLAALFVALLVAEAYLSAAFVPGLSLGHGAITWLASNAVASVVPGPSDVPLRYRMFRSWGLAPAGAATASAGATLINVASKLVLPAVAAVGIWAGHVDVGDVRALIVSASLACGAAAAVVGFAFGSEARTAAGARLAARVVRRPRLAGGIVRYRNEAAALLRVCWRRVVIGITLVSILTVVIFVWCMRAVGIDAPTASWVGLFCVWALVRGVTVLPTMPGDAGVSEVAFVSLLSQVADGSNVNTITAGIVLYRAITWIIPIPLGLGAIWVWRMTLRDRGGVGDRKSGDMHSSDIQSGPEAS